MAGAWRTVAQKATPPALYWLVLSLITFLGMSAVIKIEATRTRLSLVAVVVGVARRAGLRWRRWMSGNRHEIAQMPQFHSDTLSRLV